MGATAYGVQHVRQSRALLVMKVDPTIVRPAVRTLRRRGLVLWSEALEAGGCFDQGAVDTEVVIAQKCSRWRFLEKVLWSKLGSSISISRNHRNSR